MSLTIRPVGDGAELPPEARADSTRERILAHIVQAGPITAGELADHLDLTAAGIRRHLAVLAAAGLITEYEPAATIRERRRGRPAKSYVVTDTGQESLTSAYAAIATRAIEYLERLDPAAVRDFAAEYTGEIESRVRATIPTGSDVTQRLDALVVELDRAGYAATARPIGSSSRRVQLCHGHCPVHTVATAFPEFCEAETAMISRLLGVPVQRLATLAEGAHVCTTNIPIRAKGTR